MPHPLRWQMAQQAAALQCIRRPASLQQLRSRLQSNPIGLIAGFIWCFRGKQSSQYCEPMIGLQHRVPSTAARNKQVCKHGSSLRL